MTRQEVEIINKLGLHARASTKLTQVASQFNSQIWIERGTRRVNEKSIMGVMMLAASKGSKVTLEATGEDETAAIGALVELIGNRFGEGE